MCFMVFVVLSILLKPNRTGVSQAGLTKPAALSPLMIWV